MEGSPQAATQQPLHVPPAPARRPWGWAPVRRRSAGSGAVGEGRRGWREKAAAMGAVANPSLGSSRAGTKAAATGQGQEWEEQQQEGRSRNGRTCTVTWSSNCPALLPQAEPRGCTTCDGGQQGQEVATGGSDRTTNEPTIGGGTQRIMRAEYSGLALTLTLILHVSCYRMA